MVANNVLDDCFLDQLRDLTERKLPKLRWTADLDELRATVPATGNGILVDLFIENLIIFVGLFELIIGGNIFETLDLAFLLVTFEKVSEQESFKKLVVK